MTKLPSCSPFDTGTFSTANQASLSANSVISLTQQVLVGSNISFTPPNTINLQPGNYIVIYNLMGNSPDAAKTVLVGLRLNGNIITNSTVGIAIGTTTAAYPGAIGSYLINTNVISTLQLVARTNVVYNSATVNTSLTNNNIQTAQLTIFKLL